MWNLSLDINELDDILPEKEIKRTLVEESYNNLTQENNFTKEESTPVKIFSKILEDMTEKEEKSDTKSLIFIFENILSWHWISEPDSKIFLELINSKWFKKSYINTIKQIEYNWHINAFNASKIERKNNPLFHIWELKTKLNSLIINSKLTHLLDNSKNPIIEHWWDLYQKIWNENYKVIQTVWNISILQNNDWIYSISLNIKYIKRDIILSWIVNIPTIKTFWSKVFVNFENKDWNWLFDVESKSIILSWKKYIWYQSIWNKLFIVFEDKEWNWLFDVESKTILLSWKRELYYPHLLNWNIVVKFEDKKWLGLYDVESKTILLSWKKSISKFRHIDWKSFVDFIDILKDWEWLYDVKSKNVLLSWKEFISEIQNCDWEFFVKYWDKKWIWLLNWQCLLNINRNLTLLCWEKYIDDIQEINWKLFVKYSNKNWEWLLCMDKNNILEHDILLSWKKEIFFEWDDIFYKNHWLIGSKRKLKI